MSVLWDTNRNQPRDEIVLPGETIPAMFLAGAARRGPKVWLREKELGLWREWTWNDALRAVREIAMGLASLAMWFCGLSALTSASRTFFAFSRDRGLPGSDWIRIVHARFKTPIVAIVVASTLSVLLVLATRSNGEAFEASTSLATTGLYVSYAIPIALGAVARMRGRWKRKGPFDLGRVGVPIAWAAVAWSVFVVVVFALPPRGRFGIALAITLATLAASYLLFARRTFRGPSLTLDMLE